jgi:ATP adenylyltransferase
MQVACRASGIAKALLAHDESQIEYYTAITNNMVGRVLRNRGLVEKDGPDYVLKGFASLAPDEVSKLVAACKAKLKEFKEKRGATIWAHRRMSAGYVSGTLKFEVLKRARFRCELCGVSAEERALEADHIVPRNKGGSDDLSNLQALCYSCNAMKRDRDNTESTEQPEGNQHPFTFPTAALATAGQRWSFSSRRVAVPAWMPVVEARPPDSVVFKV